MFRQYGGLFADAEKEFFAKRGLWTSSNSRLYSREYRPLQQTGKPVVVVPLASQVPRASQEESLFKFASIEESKQFASQEELFKSDSKKESTNLIASKEELNNSLRRKSHQNNSLQLKSL